jgi:hypothetical protein
MKGFLFFITLSFILTGCMKQNPQLIKETDANKKIVLSFYENAYNLKDPVNAVSAFSGNADAVSIKGDTLLKGRTEIANSIIRFLDTFKDVKFKPEWIYAEGEMVIIRWVIDCTPKENYLTYPAGKPMEIRGAAFFRLFDRKILNSQTYWNYK